MNTSTSGQPHMLNLEEFAALIRKIREVVQWSQETLTELAGLNVRSVQRVENAKPATSFGLAPGARRPAWGLSRLITPIKL